ncbi:MAG: collagen binding domain-containing protein, partial [Sandaracinaceae bacterium]
MWNRWDRGYVRAAFGVLCLLLTLPPRFATEPASPASEEQAETPLVYEGDDGTRIQLTSPDEVRGDVHITAWNGETVIARQAGRLPLGMDLPTEGALWLRVEAPGRARYLARVVPVAGRPLVVPLPEGATLGGEVVDETGEVIADATVEFVRTEGPRAPWTTRTDASGRFSIDTLVEGSYRVGAASPGHATVATRATTGGPPLRLTLERVGLIAGRVMNAEGRPVPRAQLVIAGSGLWPARQAEADARGRFVLPDIPPGVYEVRASTDEAAAPPRRGIDLGPGDQRFLTFTLRAGRAIAGVVRDAADGSPVEGAELTLASEALGVTPRALTTDAAGRFRVGGLDADTYLLSVHAPGFVPVVARPVSPGAPADIGLDRAATVVGTVVDAEGHPIAGAQLEVIGEDAAHRPIAMHAGSAFRASVFARQRDPAELGRGARLPRVMPTELDPTLIGPVSLFVTEGDVPPLPAGT